MKSVKTLDYVVAQVQNDLKDYSENNRARFLQFAVNAYKELQFSASLKIKVAYLTIDPKTYSIALPDDYVDYTKIAINAGGTLVTLSINNNIPLVRHKDGCGDLTLQEAATASLTGSTSGFPSYGYWFTSTIRGGQYLGEQYAYGGGYNRLGYFRVDEEMHRIQFKNTVPNAEVVLEYKSSGLECDGSSFIPEDAVPAMIEWMHWRIQRFDNRISPSVVDRSRQYYIEQFNILKTRKLSFTLSEFLDMSWSNTKQGIKR